MLAHFNATTIQVLEPNDPHSDFIDCCLSPIEELKEIEIAKGRKVKIGSTLDLIFETALVDVLRCNIGAFAYNSIDMPNIDRNFLYHILALDPSTKPIIQKRRKFHEEKMKAIVDETKKLIDADHVR